MTEWGCLGAWRGSESRKQKSGHMLAGGDGGGAPLQAQPFPHAACFLGSSAQVSISGIVTVMKRIGSLSPSLSLPGVAERRADTDQKLTDFLR